MVLMAVAWLGGWRFAPFNSENFFARYCGFLMALAVGAHGMVKLQSAEDVDASAPPMGQRVAVVIVIAIGTGAALGFPWLGFHGGGPKVCNDRWRKYNPKRPSEEAEWRATRVIVQACTTLLCAFAAMPCAALWHRPSTFARAAVGCVVSLWLQSVTTTLFMAHDWCGGSRDMLKGLDMFRSMLDSVNPVWIMGLLFRRIIALESSMKRRHHSFFLSKLLSFTAVNLLASMVPFIKLPPSGASVFIWIWCPAFLFLGFGGFTVFLVESARTLGWPLQVLQLEAKRVHGIPRAEALWAAATLRREVTVVVVNSLFSVLKLAIYSFYRFYKNVWGLAHLKYSFHHLKIFIDIPYSLDLLANVVCTMILSGIVIPEDPLQFAKPPSRPLKRRSSLTDGDEIGEAWAQKVLELATRGFELGSLLDFYVMLGTSIMPGFDPERSTTNDVVRQAVIPLSRAKDGSGGHALAFVWSGGLPVLPQKMCTHNWDNRFLHLVAAIVADGLGLTRYNEVAAQLAFEGVARLREQLRERGTLGTTYWVCAFSINQHAGISGGFGFPPMAGSIEREEWDAKRSDSVSGEMHPLCNCCEPKFFNDQPIPCEMNKFDDMMAYLQRDVVGFKQVVAVDATFDLFWRAWCVAELVEAENSGIPQTVQIHSEDALQQNYRRLTKLRVQECRASRLEDKNGILMKIPDLEEFNARLQWNIFGQGGLLRTWMDGQERLVGVGHIAYRALRRASTGFFKRDRTSTQSVNSGRMTNQLPDY